jgi:3-methylcrotonyl-CoA carboxylase alpha subunit
MFRKLLVANRGEIACRVVRTARRLGIATVAVYSEADAGALHVDLADEAWPIGPAPARESYLAIDKLVDIAHRSGAQAVHPGYGFLAENPEFAETCERAGLIFVGPPSNAMRLMGSKVAAKALMERAGAPIVPGYHGDMSDAASLADAAKRLGFPLLVKASAGGGGRGMRIVRSVDELPSAIVGAEREALASFGDGRLLLEKYLARPRHIEIQIFADAHGNVVSFFERDCSVQRRHQKILEETPAPHLPSSLRREMREAAVTAAKAIGYVGAGTIEFLVQDEAYFFLEMNARLQVEHPVSEMISGQDLVEWQFRVACGENLPLTQDQLTMGGCAIEVRVCAEDPARDFLPSVGVIEHFRPPTQCEAVRVDTGVRRSGRITQHYDSLLSKVVVWGADRPAAVRRLQSALDTFELVGVMTNLDFLRAIASHPCVGAGEYDTTFTDRNFEALTATKSPAATDETNILAAAAAAWLADLRYKERTQAIRDGDASSPWAMADGWRVRERGHCDIHFNAAGRRLSAQIHPLSDGAFRLDAGSTSFLVSSTQNEDRMSLRIDGVKRDVGIVRRDKGLVVVLNGRNFALDYVDLLKPSLQEISADSQLSAPLPARVTRVYVEAGDYVQKGAPLVVLEAMKMEITLTAPRNGVVESVRCVEGEMTTEGAELIALVQDDSS